MRASTHLPPNPRNQITPNGLASVLSHDGQDKGKGALITYCAPYASSELLVTSPSAPSRLIATTGSCPNPHAVRRQPHCGARGVHISCSTRGWVKVVIRRGIPESLHCILPDHGIAIHCTPCSQLCSTRSVRRPVRCGAVRCAVRRGAGALSPRVRIQQPTATLRARTNVDTDFPT